MRDPDPDPTEQELAAEVDLPLPAGPGAEDRLIPYFRHEPWIMGILNVTPDSFSDGGRWDTADAAVARGLLLAEQGAHLVDVGGESTRPGAHRVTAQEEAARVEPVIAALSQAGVQCSIDTTRATVAQAALDAGAVLVNDVSGGLADPEMRHLVADRGCPWILMHWRGHSDVMDQLSTYGDVVADVRAELSHQVELALAAGIDERSLIVDPGLGFAKTAEHNWELLRRLPELVELGLPVLIGASRKRFLGSLLATGESDQLELGIQRPPFDPGGEPRPAAEREYATAAISQLAAAQGVWGVRVHEPGPSADVLAVVGALRWLQDRESMRTNRDWMPMAAADRPLEGARLAEEQPYGLGYPRYAVGRFTPAGPPRLRPAPDVGPVSGPAPHRPPRGRIRIPRPTNSRSEDG